LISCHVYFQLDWVEADEEKETGAVVFMVSKQIFNVASVCLKLIPIVLPLHRSHLVEERDWTVTVVFNFLIESQDVFLDFYDVPTIPDLLINDTAHDEAELLLTAKLGVDLYSKAELVVDDFEQFLVICFFLSIDLSVVIADQFVLVSQGRLGLLLLLVQSYHQVVLATKHLIRMLEVCDKWSGKLVVHV
jgi:hypothetical protein